MGNRAVITTPEKDFGVYLHWNGGLESVLAFLDTAREREYRSPVADPSYAMARLTGIVHEFFAESGLSLGIGPLSQLDCDNHDNGTYVVGADWEIIERYGKGHAQRRTVESLSDEEQQKYQGIKTALREGLARLQDTSLQPGVAA